VTLTEALGAVLDSYIAVYREPVGDEGIERLGTVKGVAGASDKTRDSRGNRVWREDDRRSTRYIAGIRSVGERRQSL
jgi:hypothetical protein